jgi:hypothetical protein
MTRRGLRRRPTMPTTPRGAATRKSQIPSCACFLCPGYGVPMRRLCGTASSSKLMQCCHLELRIMAAPTFFDNCFSGSAAGLGAAAGAADCSSASAGQQQYTKRNGNTLLAGALKETPGSRSSSAPSWTHAGLALRFTAETQRASRTSPDASTT